MKKDEKLLKSYLKRRVKITEAMIVSFLITGGILFGAADNEEILKESQTINGVANYVNEGTVSVINDNAINITGSGNGTIDNNGIISSSDGNAVVIGTGTTFDKLINSGKISAETSTSETLSGNGIASFSLITDGS